MSVKSVRGKECDINGTFSRCLSSNAIFECREHATDFILHNHLYEYMDLFSLDCKPGDIFNGFSCYNCECNLDYYMHDLTLLKTKAYYP